MTAIVMTTQPATFDCGQDEGTKLQVSAHSHMVALADENEPHHHNAVKISGQDAITSYMPAGLCYTVAMEKGILKQDVRVRRKASLLIPYGKCGRVHSVYLLDDGTVTINVVWDDGTSHDYEPNEIDLESW